MPFKSGRYCVKMPFREMKVGAMNVLPRVALALQKGIFLSRAGEPLWNGRPGFLEGRIFQRHARLSLDRHNRCMFQAFAAGLLSVS